MVWIALTWWSRAVDSVDLATVFLRKLHEDDRALGSHSVDDERWQDNDEDWAEAKAEMALASLYISQGVFHEKTERLAAAECTVDIFLDFAGYNCSISPLA